MPKHAETGPKSKRLGLAFAAIAVALASLVCFTAQTALAADSAVLAYSVDAQGNKTNYYSVTDAINDGYNSKTIVMNSDWVLTQTLDIADSKEITIDMNGHRIINNSRGRGIRLHEKAHLTLTSSVKTTFTFKGFSPSNGWRLYANLTVGGLVIGGEEADHQRGAIWAENWTTLTLDNVAIAGNSGPEGGALRIDKGSKLYMKNGASIQYNRSDRDGGGVYVQGDGTDIYMDNAYISHNYATRFGGGIYSKGETTRIGMESKSEITNNNAKAGGGIFFLETYSSVVSNDRTAKFYGNRASEYLGCGGAINYCVSAGANEGELDGILFEKNYADGEAGALYIRQSWVRVKNCTLKENTANKVIGGGAEVTASNCGFYNCTITGNSSGLNGGGLFLTKKAYVENCTITDNSCGNNSSGGGVYVFEEGDILVKGKVTINNNRGNGGAADNLFLSSSSTEKAYIKGSVAEGSKIGVRTKSSDDRLLAKDVSSYVEGTYFMDRDGYYVTHGSDHGGDLWQRHGEREFTVCLNNKVVGSFKPGATVALNGASADASEVFSKWDELNSAGLQPYSDYVKDLSNPSVTFKMPQNDVNLTADYVGYADDFKVTVARPVAGQDLPTTATLSYTNDGKAGSFTIHNIHWLDKSGAKATKAAYGGEYRFYFIITDDKDAGLVFPGSIDASQVTLACADGQACPASQDAHVDSSKRLNFTSGSFKTEAPTIESVEGASVTVAAGTSVDATAALALDADATAASTGADLASLLPTVAKAYVQGNASLSLEVDTDSDIEWPDGLVADGEVADPAGESRTYTVSLPLKSTDKAANPDGKKLDVTLTVVPQGTVAEPALSKMSGVYDKTNDVMRLSDDGTLTVEAVCSTPGATIKYTVDGGAEQAYTGAGIVLNAEENASKTHTVTVWAERGSDPSDRSAKVSSSYILDDTLQKTIQVKCTDTALYSDGAERWSASFDVTADLGAATVITAPEQAGKVFDHWVWDGAPEGTELANPTLAIDDFQLGLAEKITAVYVPVISKIDVGFAEPEAHKALSSEASYVKVGTAADGGASLDVTSYFGDSALTWLPGDSDEAEHLTSYTAALALNSSLPEGVNYELSYDATVMLNGVAIPGSLAFVTDDAAGARTLYVNFESTAPYEYKSFAQPEDVSMSFTDACTYQQDQAAGKDSDWGLPDDLAVTYACGETGIADIAWEAPAGFDPTKLEAQTLTVTGKVTYPESVDSTGAPQTVTVKINVAAPETVATPEASVQPGTYGAPQSVELSCATDGATIYYTTDGSEPTENSAEYMGEPIEVSSMTTIKAVAYADGMKPSEVVELAYVIESGQDPAPAPTPDNSTDNGAQGSDSAKQNSSRVTTTSVKNKVPATGDESSQVTIPLLALGFASLAVCASLLVAARKHS